MDLVYIKNDPKKKKYYKVHDCKFNEGCRCQKEICKRCGWNPAVAKARTEAYERRMGGG